MNNPSFWDSKVPFYMVAEIGSNHDGSLERALNLIDLCAEAGVQAVKFQLFRAESLVVPDHRAYETLDRLSVPLEWLPALVQRAHGHGLEIGATPFYHEAIAAIQDSGADFIKIASSDLTHASLLRDCAATNLPLLISTGLSTLQDVREALHRLADQGHADMALLHCCSLYPPEYGHMNLPAMLNLRTFCPVVGLSDHTPGSTMAVAALAMGARVIEKHVTDDPCRSGPDHSYALNFAQLQCLMRDLQNTSAALVGREKAPLGDEVVVAPKARRGLYAARDIAKGEILEESMLIALRPTAQVNAEHIGMMIGRACPTALTKGQALPLVLLDPSA